MTAATFVTDLGVEVPAVTAQQMAEIDRVAIEETGPNLFQMMENAGRNLALTIIGSLGPGWVTTPITVLAGTGGNGGGGICAARHLANRGANVTVVISKPEELKPVTQEQLDVYRATSGRIADVAALDSLQPGMIVDAVIGYQLEGPLNGVALQMIEWAVESANSPVLSLDIPSGVNSTTGRADGPHVRASVTMTLALPKTGMDTVPVGKVWLADIGIPAEAYRRVGIGVSPAVFGDRYRVPVRPA